MKICVYGAGAIGGHLAARLAKAGESVSVIARGAHLKAMQERGLTFIGHDQRFTVHPLATDDPAKAGPQDLVIVAVKAPALPEAADRIGPLLGPETPVVFAMNGIPWWYFHQLPGPHRDRRLERVDPDGRIWRQIGPERAIGCVVYSANEVTEPGVVHNESARNRYILGEPDGTVSARCRHLSEALVKGGVEAPVAADIRAAIWAKLAGNVAFGPTAALTGATLDAIGKDPELNQLGRQMVAETAAVAAALGVKLGPELDRIMDPNLPRPAHKPSLLQDLERGRPMEIDGMLGTLQDLARLANVPTPQFDAVLALLQQRARMAGLYR